MNCRPNDIARIVREIPGCEENLDRLVMVMKPGPLEPEGATWRIEPLSKAPFFYRDQGGCFHVWDEATDSLCWHPDAWLRPIRDPGEDAVDEMLRIAGRPLSESHRSITAPKRQVEHAR